MPAQVAIVHGWSDSSKSFHNIRGFLARSGFQAAQVSLADYISMEDDVRIEDVAKRMQAVVQGEIQANRLNANFDLIVHSTGGLVAREWVSRFYPDGKGCPAKRIIMLAPANFGSALAHLGKSMIGRVAKGWDNWFQTGTEMLRGLELASPYQWNLACRDLLDPSTEGPSSGPFGADKIWPFVIVGSRAYPSGLRQIVNENGSDGTVRAAAANLNAVGMTIDFTGDPEKPVPRIWGRRGGPIPFAVLPDRDHSTITDPGKAVSVPAFSDQLGQLIVRALTCKTPKDYADINVEWAAVSDATAKLARDPAALGAAFKKDAPKPEALHQYFHVVTRVRDDHGRPVDDYFLEFFAAAESEQTAVYFHKHVLEDVHVNGEAKSLRALFADRNDLMDNYYSLIPQKEKHELLVSISATQVGKNILFFDSHKVGAKGSFVVHREVHEQRVDLTARLFRNTTHLIDIVIPRQPVDKVFVLSQ